MPRLKKSFEEINERIRSGKAVVLTANEMSDLVDEVGPARAAAEVDVVTTGTFGMMCSSSAMFNFGHTTPRIKSSRVWFNDVPAYAGMAAVDAFLGATETKEDDPLNKVHPGRFLYGGGHVIEDLVAGKTVTIKVDAYGTDCYPKMHARMEKTLEELPYAMLLNPRNAYQNYNCAVNMGEDIIYTYMGVLRPRVGNANYATSGQLSPLLNDPYCLSLGLGTRIFLGGAQGYITWAGTQHKLSVKREGNGVPSEPGATLMVMGNLKEMSPRWIVGVSILGYGCSLTVGIGVPIPILNEDLARYTGVSDEEIFTQIIDYGKDYPHGRARSLGKISYAALKSGTIEINGQSVQTAPISSFSRAREIAEILKEWIQTGQFFLSHPQHLRSDM